MKMQAWRGAVWLLGGAVALGMAAVGAVTRLEARQDKPFIEPSEMHGKTHVRAALEAEPGAHGRWETLPFDMPLNPVHVALMHTGRVLIVSGSGNDPDNHNLQAAVWDPERQTVRTFQIGWDMFCNGMVVLPDGKPLVLGGTLQYDPFFGEPRTAEFDPRTETFTNTHNMSGGRWYPTGTVLGDGSVLVYSGLIDTSETINPTVEIGTGRSWHPAGTAFAGVPLYPRQHLLPNGKVFEDGANRTSQLYDPATHAFTAMAPTILPQNRDYGTSVLLPLTPANGWKPKVIIMGGVVKTATDTTERIDLSLPSPVWEQGPAMVKPRVQLNATLLPNGKVLVSGGSQTDEDSTTAVLEAQLYDPDSNTFSSASTMEFPRLYHSNTLLLPDGRVAALGGNPERTVYVPEIEIYSPSYLFKPDGTPAKRPSIGALPQASLRYGAPFHLGTPDAAHIRSVVLIRAGAVTHAFDMDQRLVGLTFTPAPGGLKVTAPANGNLAPPGYYLLFLLDDQGVPSPAKFVHLGAVAGGIPKAKPKAAAGKS